MTNDRMELPPRWADDDLSSFLGAAQQNVHGSFHRKKSAYDLLRTIGDCFMKVASNLLNPKDQIAPLLLLRSHSGYRTTCGLAMSGQVVESFAMARLCAEYAGYGLYIHDDPNLVTVWFDKRKGVAEKKAFLQVFTPANIRGCIERYDARLAAVYVELYQRAIDTGGHPNELAVSGSMKIENHPESDQVHIQQFYLQSDGLPMDCALKSAAQTGICSLHLFQWVFRSPRSKRDAFGAAPNARVVSRTPRPLPVDAKPMLSRERATKKPARRPARVCRLSARGSLSLRDQVVNATVDRRRAARSSAPDRGTNTESRRY
jgi:hypothetical protein